MNQQGRNCGSREGVEALEAKMLMLQAITHFIGSPVAVGIGNASLASKFASLVWVLRLHQRSWALLSKFCRKMVSMTTDWGMESQLVHVPPISEPSLWPWWHSSCIDERDVAQEIPMI